MQADKPNLPVEGDQPPALDNNVTAAISTIVTEKVEAALATAREDEKNLDPRPDVEDARAAPRDQPGAGNLAADLDNWNVFVAGADGGTKKLLGRDCWA